MSHHKLISIAIALILLLGSLGLGLTAQAQPNAFGEQPPPLRGGSASAANHTGNGPFGPPVNTDSSYSIDSGTPLDEYLYRDSAVGDITILGTRVVGISNFDQLIDPDGLIANGVLSAKGAVQILAWDVDSDYKGGEAAPEVDQVYLNGYYLGELTGVNDAWSVTTLEFDISILRFSSSSCWEGNSNSLPNYLSNCNSGPLLYDNRITIVVDSANTSPVWGTEIDWAAISFSAARPVLFVHGRGEHLDEGSAPYPSSTETDGPSGESQAAMVNPWCYDNPESFGCIYWQGTDGTYFNGFRQKIAQAGWLTQITENELVGENSTLTNAGRLANTIELMKKRYRVEQIDIVAHGKGGLDARAYISDPVLNADDNVATLITLASPHQGSYLADLASDLPGFALGEVGEGNSSALANLTEAYTSQLFNLAYPARWGVEYYTIGGDAGVQAGYGPDMPPEQSAAFPSTSQQVAASWTWSAVQNSGSQAGINDGQASAASSSLAASSGHSPGNTVDLGVLPRNHHSMRAAISQLGVDDTSVVDLIQSVLDVQPGYGQAGPPTPGAPAGSSSTVSSFSGKIMANETLVHPLGIDSASTATFLLLWDRGDLSLNLVDPGGGLHTSDQPGEGVSFMEDNYFDAGDYNTLGEFFAYSKAIRYHIAAPLNGNWQAEVIAGPEQPPEPLHYMLLLSQECPVHLSLETDAAWYKVGDPVIVRARLAQAGSPLAGARVKGQAIFPTGLMEGFDLFDDGSHADLLPGDGVYANSFVANEFGIYRLSAFASGTAPGGISFQRTAVYEIQAASGTAVLGLSGYGEQTIDLDGDGLFDRLQVHVPLTIAAAGDYMVSATLEDAQGVPLAWANGVLVGDPGDHLLNLEFYGEQMWAAQQPGPYWLRQVRLIDRSSLSLPVQVDFLPEAYQTAAYDPDSFQHNPLEYLGSRDYGVDDNANEKYDWLVFDVSIKVDKPGTYQWRGDLMLANGDVLASYAANAMLNAGVNTLSLKFPGQQIFMSHQHGSYLLVKFSLLGDGGMLPSIPTIESAPYNYGEFEPMPEIFFPQVVNSTSGFLVNGDFEDGRGSGWSVYSSNGFPLITSVGELPMTPYSGSWAAWLGGTNYENSMLSQPTSIAISPPALTFWYWISSYDYCGYDYASVYLAGVKIWQVDLCYYTRTDGWVLAEVNLNAVAGQSGQLEFVVSTDNSLSSSFFVDDVDLGGGTAPVPLNSPPVTQELRQPVMKVR